MKRPFYLLFLPLIILYCSDAFGQRNNYLERAQIAYDEGKFSRAISYYKKALSKEYDAFAALELAECYEETNQLEEASQVYKIILEQHQEEIPLIRFEYAASLKKLGNYPLAIQEFNTFLEEAKLVKGRAKRDAKYLTDLSQKEIQGCELALKDPVVEILEMGYREVDEIDSSFTLYSPAIHPTTGNLWVTTENARQKGNFQRFKYTGGQWFPFTQEDGFRYVNSGAQEEGGAFSPDGNTFFFVKSQRDYPYEIWYSEKIKGRWVKPKPLEDKVNNPYYDNICPSLSSSGDTLFFSSNRPRGKGGFDIWFSVKNKNGEWKKAQNLEAVNTEEDEVAPYYDGSSDHLYFSSAGHITYGGLDIFSYSFQDGSIHNLGAPINSFADDAYFVKKGDLMLFSSQRKGNQFRLYEINTRQKEVLAQEMVIKEVIAKAKTDTSFTTTNAGQPQSPLANSTHAYDVTPVKKITAPALAPANYQEEALAYYEGLDHQQKNKVERIMATMWMNMRLTMAPQLTEELKQEWASLAADQQAELKRIGRYYWAKSRTQRSALAAREEQFVLEHNAKSPARWRSLIIYYAFRHDEEGMIKMSKLDWEFLKSLRQEDVDKIKYISSRLREIQMPASVPIDLENRQIR